MKSSLRLTLAFIGQNSSDLSKFVSRMWLSQGMFYQEKDCILNLELSYTLAAVNPLE